MVDLSGVGITNAQHLPQPVDAGGPRSGHPAREGAMAQDGPLVVRTGQYTGAPPRTASSSPRPPRATASGGRGQPELRPRDFERLKVRLLAYLQGKDLFVQDVYAGADPRYASPCASSPRRPGRRCSPGSCSATTGRPESSTPSGPGSPSSPPRSSAHPRSRRHPQRGLHPGAPRRAPGVIGGTSYAGEIKKSVFTVMNYMLRCRGCSACTPRPTSARKATPPSSSGCRARQDHPVAEGDGR